MYPEDVAAGFERRRVWIKLHEDLLCDFCGGSLPVGTTALAETMSKTLRAEPEWESAYGTPQ